MSASLVGSEMCIRDRCPRCMPTARPLPHPRPGGPLCPPPAAALHICPPVSYTHLTLPTICSV
eukprot:9962792-Alexandrium_andersonii.AAC.1